jgi:hypothetical protein
MSPRTDAQKMADNAVLAAAIKKIAEICPKTAHGSIPLRWQNMMDDLSQLLWTDCRPGPRHRK